MFKALLAHKLALLALAVVVPGGGIAAAVIIHRHRARAKANAASAAAQGGQHAAEIAAQDAAKNATPQLQYTPAGADGAPLHGPGARGGNLGLDDGEDPVNPKFTKFALANPGSGAAQRQARIDAQAAAAAAHPAGYVAPPPSSLPPRLHVAVPHDPPDLPPAPAAPKRVAPLTSPKTIQRGGQ